MAEAKHSMITGSEFQVHLAAIPPEALHAAMVAHGLVHRTEWDPDLMIFKAGEHIMTRSFQDFRGFLKSLAEAAERAGCQGAVRFATA